MTYSTQPTHFTR